ncbi:glycosyltransferase [Methylomonas sp. CM2]|uniref:glycosyltransferase n=1 Tax=Methylomonas sp. CM2 TaxID=3417647 RepID=UPI003CF3882C
MELQEVIKEYGLQNRVFFPGVIFDIADYIAEVDVVAAPFTEPHFARPILEAGAMKTLVIASDIDGTREMILNGEAGYLARPNDIKHWSEQLSCALSVDNGDKITAMFNNTQRTYNADVNAQATIEQYRIVLEFR